MTTHTIPSRIHGPVLFVCADRDDPAYVRVTCDALGWAGRQPCDGGGFSGSTLIATSETLPTVARRWWRQYMRAQRHCPATYAITSDRWSRDCVIATTHDIRAIAQQFADESHGSPAIITVDGSHIYADGECIGRALRY